MSRRVRVVAEFEAGGYTEPVGFAELMLRQAGNYIATQQRAARGSYREQVWSFLGELVRAAKVETKKGNHNGISSTD